MISLKKILSEGMADNILVKVIAVVKDEYAKGNKNDIVSLMNTVNKKTKYRVYDAHANNGPASGMQGFTVGEFAVLVCLVDKSKYKSALSKQESKENIKYTKIGNWWIRLWD
jgi:hypothetical protein